MSEDDIAENTLAVFGQTTSRCYIWSGDRSIPLS